VYVFAATGYQADKQCSKKIEGEVFHWMFGLKEG
jgi:hypothetical protein